MSVLFAPAMPARHAYFMAKETRQFSDTIAENSRWLESRPRLSHSSVDE
jgi:hypothetical protein